MKHLFTVIFTLLFFPIASFSQHMDMEKAIRKEFGNLSIDEIKDELEKGIYQINKLKTIPFKSKEEVSRLLNEKGRQNIYTYEIEPYKEYTKDDIKKAVDQAHKSYVFFQHPNAVETSFISLSDSDNGHIINEKFPYHSKRDYPTFTAIKLYYADGTSEDCDYDITGEIPTGKPISEIDIKADYIFYADVKRIELSDNRDYTEGDKFARLVGIEGDEAKLWMSDAIYQKAFVVADTKSGKTVHSSTRFYAKEIKGHSESAIQKVAEMKEDMQKIYVDIENGKFSDTEQIIKEIIKIFPKEILKNEAREYALSFITDGDPIEKVYLIVQEGTDTISTTFTISNADVMSDKIGVRLRGKTLTDNTENLIAEIPFVKVEPTKVLCFRREEKDYGYDFILKRVSEHRQH